MKIFQHQKARRKMELKVSIYRSPEEAPHYTGNVYLEANKANIVLNGMSSGAPTIDFEMFDKDGKLHTVMLSGSVLRALASVVEQFDHGGGNRNIRVELENNDHHQPGGVGDDRIGG